MKEKTLYITDLDGTLLHKDKTVGETSEGLLNTFIGDGGHFTIATARTIDSAIDRISGLNFSLPVVTMNGAGIYDIKSEKYDLILDIANDTAKKIIKILSEHKLTVFYYTVIDDKMVVYIQEGSGKETYFKEQCERIYGKRFTATDSIKDIISEHNLVYVIVVESYERLSGVYEELSRTDGVMAMLYHDVYHDGTYFLEIFSENASKETAVRYLREQYGFDKVVAFGDNLNDLALFAGADESYAVSNGLDELKAVATGVIGSNEEDSVAKFVCEI